MIPKDGRWIFRFNTRSAWDQVDRYVKEKKFYATLPRKLDVEIEEYLRAIEDSLKDEWEFWEELDGETPLGGEMRSTHKSVKDS